MAKRIGLSFFSVLLIATMLLGFMPAQPVRAGTETYNHIIPFTITDTSGVARTQLPVIITYDVNGRLVAYGLTNATTTDTYVDSSGAGNSPVGSGTAYDYLMATDNITVVIPSLPAYGSYTINLYTGYAPVQTVFPVITGEGGYLTTADDDAIELSDNFTIEQSGWITTTFTDNYSARYLVHKQGAFITYVSGAESITSAISSWESPTSATGASWTDRDKTYDENTGTFAWDDIGTDAWSGDITISIGAVQCSQFRHWVSRESVDVNEIDIDVYYSGAWHDIYQGGTFTVDDWETREIGSVETVTAVKFRFYNDNVGVFQMAYVNEVDFESLDTTQVTATGVSTGEHTIRTTTRSVLTFDGNDAVTVLDDNSLSFTDGAGTDEAFTMMAWIKPDVPLASGMIMAKRISAVQLEYVFLLLDTGKFYCRLYQDGVIATYINKTIDVAIEEGVWLLVGVTYDGSEAHTGLTMYVNGDAVAATGSSAGAYTGMGNSSANFTIGAQGDGTVYFEGGITLVRIYKDRALSAPEMAEHFRDIFSDDTDLTAKWDMDEGSGNTVYDTSPNNNDGTISGAIWRGGMLKLYIDDVLEGRGGWGTVSDNDNDWTWIQNDVMPYMDYATIDLDGVEVLKYEPTGLINGTALPDVTGTNDAVITWGTNTDIAITGGDIMDSNSATSVGTTSAQMQGNLFYIGTYAAVYLSFEYGLDATYGYFTSETSAAGEQTFAVTLTGLTPNTTYHFRAIARNGVVYSYGEDITFTTAYATASQGSTTPLIISIGVFSGYQETGDLLFTAEIVLTYPPYYPTETAYHYFQMQLIDTDGTTILGASPISQWGDRPSSIYFNPTVVASALTYGDNYTIRITNVSSDNLTITTAEDLEPTDWRGDNLDELDEWCIGVATSMQNTDGTILTDPYLKSDPTYGIIITSTPGGFFVKGIPNIASVRPNLFTTGEHKAAIPSVTSTIGYNAGTTLTDRVGATIVADAQTVADVFSLTGQMFLLYMIFGVVLFCVLYTVSKTQGFGALGALCLSLPIMGASIYFNITDVQLFVLGGIICAILFVRQFILKTL